MSETFRGIDDADATALKLEAGERADVADDVAAGREDLVGRYFDMLASEGVDAVPAAQMHDIVQQVSAASKRPQTATIVRLVKEIQALGAFKPQELARVSAQLARELEKSDNVLWNELEGEDDEYFGQIAYAFDRANNFPG